MAMISTKSWRGFNANGSERIGDFTVNTVASGQQLAPGIGMASNGDFAIAFEMTTTATATTKFMRARFTAMVILAPRTLPLTATPAANNIFRP